MHKAYITKFVCTLLAGFANINFLVCLWCSHVCPHLLLGENRLKSLPITHPLCDDVICNQSFLQIAVKQIASVFSHIDKLPTLVKFDIHKKRFQALLYLPLIHVFLFTEGFNKSGPLILINYKSSSTYVTKKSSRT